MTRNTKGGKGHRKSKSGEGGIFRRELLLKEEGQEYALVTKILGNGHVECTCFDNVVRLGNIRGKIRRRVWITLGDVVLVGLREYQDNKADVLHKYNPEEIKNLQNMNELPEKFDDLGETTPTVKMNSLFQEAKPQEETEEEIDFSAI